LQAAVFNRYELKFEGKFVEVDYDDVSNFKTKQIYESDKIFVRRIGKEIIAYLDTDKFYNVCDVYNLLPKNKEVDLYEILGLINSRLINYYFKNFFKNAKELFPKIPIKYLKQIPIKLTNGKIGVIAKNIQEAKKNGNDITSLANKLDAIVFKLYELNYNDVKLIDPNFSLDEGQYNEFKF
jgi:adenine-specific DNA-methyltransferase